MGTTLLDDEKLRDKWFRMSVEDQISNIGSEVNRAINWENKGNIERSRHFCNYAKQLLQLSIEDPKNTHRVSEFSNCIDELDDRFFGDNKYNTTDEMLRKYYDAFL